MCVRPIYSINLSICLFHQTSISLNFIVLARSATTQFISWGRSHSHWDASRSTIHPNKNTERISCVRYIFFLFAFISMYNTKYHRLSTINKPYKLIEVCKVNNFITECIYPWRLCVRVRNVDSILWNKWHNDEKPGKSTVWQCSARARTSDETWGHTHTHTHRQYIRTHIEWTSTHVRLYMLVTACNNNAGKYHRLWTV